MEEQEFKQMAAQLRKPTGEAGVKMGEWMNQGNLQINLDTLKILKAGNSDNILEIGMGNGFFVKDILNNNPFVNYIGCDFSQEMVEASIKINEDWIQKNKLHFFKLT